MFNETNIKSQLGKTRENNGNTIVYEVTICAIIKRPETPVIGNFCGLTILILKKIEGPGDMNEGTFYRGIALLPLGFLRHCS